MGDRRADAARIVRDWAIVVRRARASDRDAVLAFATNTFDGWDYIPEAWPVWLDATDGVMLVATRPNDDQPVAITRIALMSPTDAWLEGIRVDPQVRGTNVASDLQVAELLWVAAQRATVVRYATSARNEGSHRLGARNDITPLCAYRNYLWSPNTDGDPHDPSGFDAAVRAEVTAVRGRVLDAFAADGRVAAVADSERLWTFLSDEASFNAAQRLYEPRPWALCELTADRFARHVERGEVITIDGRAVAILLREQLVGEDSSLRPALLVGDVEGTFELLERTRELAGRTFRFRLPLDSALDLAGHDRLIAAGYHSSDWALHILGRLMDGAHPLPDIDAKRLILADEPQPILEPPRF
ncbi:MAG: hypothetical protein ABI744_04610 [Chloroflexota bacterium]